MKPTEVKRITAQVGYDEEDEPITLSKVTMDIFLKEEHPEHLLALYCFYYSTAKWQEKKFDTRYAKATNGYVARGLHWSIPKVIKYKQSLKRLGFITEIVKKDEKTGKIKGYYIRVKFFYAKTPMNIQCDQNPVYGQNQSKAIAHTNTEETLKEIPKETLKENTASISSDQKPEALTIKSNPESEQTPLVPPAPPDPNHGWSKRVMGVWSEAIGGRLEGWRLKGIKPLVLSEGQDVVLVALKAYLASLNDKRYASIRRFAETFGVWKPVKAVTRKFVTREETFMKEQGMNREEFEEWDRKRKEGGETNETNH